MGVNMMTLETQYIISPLESLDLRFTYLKNTILPLIPANMQACASRPEYGLSANTPSEITDAMSKLFATAITSAPRLTQ